jgi:hypothetical protein
MDAATMRRGWSPEQRGYNLGWHAAARYARGTRRDRREVRRLLAKSAASGAPFWASFRDAFVPRAADFADAIREGRLPRTCRPSKLYTVADRCG